MTDASREAAAAILGDVATEEVEQLEDTAAEEVQHEAEEELPQDIQELLSQPDFEDDEDLEPVAEEDIEDYDVDALRRRAIKAEKRAKYVEDLRIADQRKKWVSESERYFKYAKTDEIKATSRRGFLKQAEIQHNAVKDIVDRALASEREKLKTETDAERTQQRVEQAEAWGQPIQGAPTPTRAAENNERIHNALSRNRPLDAVRARLSDPNDPIFKAFQ